MIKPVSVSNRLIGPDQPVYLIAEIGGNFVELAAAKRLIDLAVKAGVDAVKLQHYCAETITSRNAVFDMENTGVVPQYDLFKKYEISRELTFEVFDYCRRSGIACFSTPSHRTDLSILEECRVPAYKVGSDDAVNIPFLKEVARLGKPILLSTGMCTLSEVQRSVDAILEEGNDQVVLLHCTTNYPTYLESVNLRAMVTLQSSFFLPVGYSDHTLGIDVCYAAAVLGAAVLEFHFTYDKKAEGPDHMLSKDLEDAATLVRRVRELPILLGDGVKRPMPTEMNTRRNNRKSLVVATPIKAGERITMENIDIKRPGYGIPCEHYYSVLGKAAGRDLKAEDVLEWKDLF